jgi:ABC-type polysaccharide/polyol phosphate export permease
MPLSQWPFPAELPAMPSSSLSSTFPRELCLSPEIARYYLSFNPVLHAVEWMRSAYYPDYGSLVLDKTYLLYWGIGTVFVGLGLERLLRGRLLGG